VCLFFLAWWDPCVGEGIERGRGGVRGGGILVCCIGSTMSVAILVVFGIQIVFQEYILEL
jgi:hypothetical protein